jgi:hypothetical protein
MWPDMSIGIAQPLYDPPPSAPAKSLYVQARSLPLPMQLDPPSVPHSLTRTRVAVSSLPLHFPSSLGNNPEQS